MAKIKFRSIYKYTEEFKATAVALSRLNGVAVKDVAHELAIHPLMLSRWRKQSREGQIVSKKVKLDDKVASDLKELKQLKKDHARLQMEHDLLKKAIAFTSIRNRTSSPSSTTTHKPTKS